MKVRTVGNAKLTDDEFIEECMDKLMDRWPQITGYVFERVDGQFIQVLMWGDIADDTLQ